VVVHACNPRTQEVHAGASQVPSQPGLNRETLSYKNKKQDHKQANTRWKPKPQRSDVQRWDLGKRLGHEGWGPLNEISAFTKESPEDCSFHHVRPQ
jgi:hypothetical protein